MDVKINKKLYNLSNPQKSIWYTEQFYKNTNINNICGTAIINVPVNFDVLKKAINLSVQYNDSFRMHITSDKNDIKQYINSFSEFDIEIIDIKSKNEISNIEQSLSKKIFELFNSNLFEFKIFRLPNQTGGFILNIHHLLSDSWTLGLICKKIMTIYENILNNKTVEIISNQSYIKFLENESNYNSSSRYIKDKLYWETTFSSVPNIVNLSRSKNDSISVFSCTANRTSFSIPKDKLNQISNFCTHKKISIFNFFMTALSIYIYKATNTNNFVIGTPILNRSNFNEKNTTGMFINIAPLLINLENNFTVSQILTKISADSMSLLRHQRYPYSEILKHVRKQDSNFPTLFNILLSYQITKTTTNSVYPYTTRWAFNGTCADDLDIQIYDLNESGELNISYDYKISKYTEDDIQNLHSKLLHIIEQILLNSDITIDNIEILSTEEKKKIIYDFNNTNIDYNKSQTIVELFEEQVRKTPKNIAVIFENSSITYEDINKKANQIAYYLRTHKNIGPGDFVPILLNRSIDLITAILAVVKSGATYVAIDPEYPKDRIEYMLENCKSKLIIVNEKTQNIVSTNLLEKVFISSDEIYNNSNFNNLKILSNPDDLLYVIYTSGSTGKPKGVSIKNLNVNNFIIGMRNIIDFSKTKSMLSVATVCFDMFVFELWGCLLNGLKLILANEQQQKLPPLLNKLCIENNVDIFQTTPSRFKLLFDNNNTECFTKIKYILIGGESVPEFLFNKLLEYKNLEVLHMYGPTETTVWSTYKKIYNSSKITIGTPIANTQVYILR